MGMFYQSSQLNAASIMRKGCKSPEGNPCPPGAKKPEICDISWNRFQRAIVNYSITITVQDDDHQYTPERIQDGDVMLNSFAKDWARWSSAERFAARLIGLVGIFSIAGELITHMV